MFWILAHVMCAVQLICYFKDFYLKFKYSSNWFLNYQNDSNSTDKLTLKFNEFNENLMIVLVIIELRY